MNCKHWLFSLLLLASAPALGTTYFAHRIGIGDFCDPVTPFGCFYPSRLAIQAGDTVTFYSYVEEFPTGAHNVVADDGSFRCAVGCDGEGGDGTPVKGPCDDRGFCKADPKSSVRVTRRFDVPGIVKYHDEVSLSAGVIFVLPRPTSPIGAGATGSWFNPDQNGHGFAIEVLPGTPMRMLASWFTFSPEGGQSWIVGLGPMIDDNRAVLQGYQSAGDGGRFPPNFDATYVHQEDWGTLTFIFSDCSHGHVEWVSSIPGYGSGGMDLTRLTLPAGLTCSP